jgi:hypothetical protein
MGNLLRRAQDMLDLVEAPTMEPTPKRRKKAAPKGADDRVVVIVLKDSPRYRQWVAKLTEATLIPTATIVRDALAKWAADRRLPAPPAGPSRRVRRP